MSTALDEYTELGFKGPKPKPKSAEQLAREAAEREAMRQRNRAHIKRRIVERQQAESRVEEMDAALRVIESCIDQLAVDHQAKCNPLQLELKQAEDSSVDRVLANEPPSEAIELRKRELRTEIEAANLELETSLRAERDTLERLQKERLEVALTLKDFPTETALISSGRRDLADKLKVASNGVQWANARLNAAKDKASKFRATSWLQLEIEAATKALADAKEAEAGAWQTIIDE